MRGRCHAILFALLMAAPAAALAQEAPGASAPCPVPPAASWSLQEQFAWKQICHDDPADFTVAPGNLLPDQTLGTDFFETILTDGKYRGAIKRHGVRVTGAHFTKRIDLQNVKLENELWFEQCIFDDGADMSWVQSTQPIAFNHSRARGPLNFYAAQLASDLHVTDSVIDQVNLTGAHVGGTLDLSRSRSSGTLDLPGIDVGTDLFLDDGDYKAGTDDDSDTKATNMSGARVGHTLSMTRSRFGGEIDLRYSQIGGELDWRGASFGRNIDLTAARVGGAFLLGSERRARSDDDPGPAKWSSERASLTARYAKIGIIPRLSDAWPGALHIVGMSYDGIAYDDDIAGVRNDFDSWFARQKYSRQPYEQLANVLLARGEIETATAVRFAERERDRDRSWSEHKFGIYIWLTMLWAVIGYGYHPEVALIWVVVFVVIGVFVLHRSGEGRRNGMPWGVSYSFDMLLPIIRLREQHYDIDIAGRARYYFYVHKIVGWALASFLLAGLSGLTK